MNMDVVMRVEGHLSLSELKRPKRCEKDADRTRRLRIVILGMEDWTAPAVGMAVELSRRVFQTWVAQHNAPGLDGLEDQRSSYERIALTSELEAELAERIEAGPCESDLVCSLRGQDLQRILASEFGVQRSLAAVYHLLHRPRHRKADPHAIIDFKQQ